MIYKRPSIKSMIKIFNYYYNNEKLLEKIKLVFRDPQKMFSGSVFLNFLWSFELQQSLIPSNERDNILKLFWSSHINYYNVFYYSIKKIFKNDKIAIFTVCN